MSTFNYILGHTLASTYNGENTILVKNSGNPNNASIGASAFEGRITTGSVSLEFESGSHCKIIQNNAFMNCPGLTSVTFPPSITTINAQAFRLSDAPATGKGLSSVTFTDIANSGLLIIRAQAFYLQSHLTSITLPKSLTNIVHEAFYKCGLQTLTIEPSDTTGSSLVGIETQAFQYNNGMTVNINKATATTIGATVPSQSTSFYGAVNVTTVNYPNTFYYTPGTTSPSAYNNESTIKVMNGGQTQIPQYAFSSGGVGTIISGSVSLTFESSSTITFINTEAFTGCSGLTNVTLPASLSGIGLDVFQHCDLTTLTIEPSGSGSIIDYWEY